MQCAQGLGFFVCLKLGKMGTGGFASDDHANGAEDWCEKPVWEGYFCLENLEMLD